MFAPKIDEIHFVPADGSETVCFDVVAELAALGYKDTPKNRDAICEKVINDIRQQRPGIKIVAVAGGGNQN